MLKELIKTILRFKYNNNYSNICFYNMKSKTMSLLFIHLIKDNKKEFEQKVKEISSRLKVNPNWLMFLMWFETARTMNHTTTNSIGATGLIQFLPSTAKGLGTTTKELREMSNVEQLEYVYKHLRPFTGKYRDFVDLYMAIF